ncbi:putative Multi-sensor signal transduction histidine kinase [Candidatus Sulfobium mesophilum]|uniref:histidine kinase n=1 Tax=Candidatus Sulfobium mesophilum TaxID=2016548 RepID=A0A2U3QIF7_9BACT|nr:putative Multi-sensor signal transduction histidine kinase [Candidatus Sulfobium mesophilum]
MIIRTFRLRLTIIYTLVVGAILSAFGTAIYFQYKGNLSEKIDSYLIKEAKEEILVESNPKLPSKNRQVIQRFGDEFYEIIDSRGQVLITSLSAEKRQWPLDTERMMRAFKGMPQFRTVNLRGVNYRTLYYPISSEKILRIVLSLEEIDDSIRGVRNLFLLSLPFVIMMSFVASWFLSGKALAPIVKIKQLASHVREGRLGKRIEMESKGREIQDLVVIFNDMLDGIQQSVEAQKRFTAAVSHEVRSPLTSLRGNIEVALRKKRTTEEYEDLLKTNLSDIIRLSRITDNLLFFTKADNNIIELRKQWFEVSHILQNIVERLKYRALAAGITIFESYQDGIEMRGDLELLEQAFSNIIENAINYTTSGGTIAVNSKKEDDKIIISINDTGIGIPEEEVPHLFERFYRVNKERSRKSGGTGLGLSITEWVVHAHDGNIEVKSSLGVGSEFITTFPASSD